METLHPGTYLQEVASEQPVEGVSTSIRAFVGLAERGLVGQSVQINSWKEFLASYGNYTNNSYLAYAVRGFFENGGTKAVVNRVVHVDEEGNKTSTKATAELKAELAGVETVVGIFDAYSDGVWGDKVQVEISNGSATGTYNITVLEGTSLVEAYTDVPLEELDETINLASTYIKYTAHEEEGFTIAPQTIALVGGTDGLEGITTQDYLDGLVAFDQDEINLISIPGITDKATVEGIISYVENRADCSAVLATPFGMKPKEAIAYTKQFTSARINFYYGWLLISDPIGIGKNPVKYVPNDGHVSGVYARIDGSRGVFKAPAGTEAKVQGILGIEYNVSDEEQDLMNPIGLNAIRTFEGEGTVIWGARTRSATPDFRYTQVRRSLDYVGQSLLKSTRWAVFESNDSVLWGKITSIGEAFLSSYWKAGGFKGESESEAYFFNCNATTVTQDDIDNGRLFAEVGVAPQKPAEFIIFKLSMLK